MPKTKLPFSKKTYLEKIARLEFKSAFFGAYKISGSSRKLRDDLGVSDYARKQFTKQINAVHTGFESGYLKRQFLLNLPNLPASKLDQIYRAGLIFEQLPIRAYKPAIGIFNKKYSPHTPIPDFQKEMDNLSIEELENELYVGNISKTWRNASQANRSQFRKK